MSDSLHQLREALGGRLRELRLNSGLTGTELADLARWHQTKVSKIEYGKTKPTDADIRTWCEHTNSMDQVPDLIATVRNIEASYLEWRRVLGTGTKRRQQASIKLEAQTQLMRWYEPVLIPGLLQTAEYAEEIMRNVIEFQGIPNDLDDGVSKRMERQQILYQRKHRFHFVIGEQALRTTVGDDRIMTGQLDRLLAVLGMPRVLFGIVPAETPLPSTDIELHHVRRSHSDGRKRDSRTHDYPATGGRHIRARIRRLGEAVRAGQRSPCVDISGPRTASQVRLMGRHG